MKADLHAFDQYQRDIILENSGRDIVVSASAGAGKTMVLVGRILKRVIDDKIPVSRILALTFTAAAAEEMKNRLAKQFHQLRDEAVTDEEKIYLNTQISLLAAADITTIDAYCLNIIRRFGSVIGIDPAAAANILSAGKNEALQKEAFTAALCAMCQSEEGTQEILQLLEYFSPRPENYDRLYEIVAGINTRAQCDPDPAAWYARCRSFYIPFTSLRQLPETIRSEWFSFLFQKCSSILDNAQELHERLVQYPEKKVPAETLIQTINLMNHCLLCIRDDDYDGFLIPLKDAAVNKIVKLSDPLSEKIRTDMHAKISDLLEICYETSSFAQNSALQAEVIDTLTRLCEETAVQFRRLKTEKGGMNFSDMERYALEILTAENSRIAAKINASLDEIMIDEFQDTSFLQDRILVTIARAHKNIPIFRVGDVKQSIYRFRQAKPQLMRDLIDSEDTAVFSMRYNYRSNESIVEFTNLLFERLMNIPGIQDHYREEDHVSAGTPEQKKTKDSPAVTLNLIRPGTDSEGNPLKPDAREVKNMKASLIASKICEMIQRSDGKLHFSDFAVLSRSHADQIVLRRQFDRYGIPYDLDAREGFFKSDLCRDIYSIARAIRDPQDEIALCAIVTSPLFSWNAEMLARTKISAPVFSEGLYIALPRLRQLLEEYRNVLSTGGICDLLSAIANTPVSADSFEQQPAFYDVLNRQDQANFDYLCSLASSAQLSDLNSLIREIEDGEAENSSEAITAGNDDDVVTVTTIHHSKGLQYPIVFLWGTGENPHREAAEAVLIDDELMLGIRDIDPEYRTALPTIQRILIRNRADLEDIEEFSRVLYVAVTRAKDRLILIDMEDNAEEKKERLNLDILTARNGITGLVTAMMDHAEGINENGLLEVHTLYPEEIPEPSEFLSAGLQPSETAMPHLRIHPSILPEIRTPSSLEKSRSALNAEGAKPSLPLFTEKQTGGSNYGTLMHKAAEMMDDSEEWTRETIRLTADPSLPERAIEDLYAFGHSDLYQECRTMEIHKEYPFYYENEEARINGTIDLAAIGKEEIIIIDFKTDRLSPEEIREEYAPQLNTYRKAMRFFFPDHKIRVYAWSFHHSIAIEIDE